MSDLVIVYWRDIPAQVISGSGRRGLRVPLPERFEQAIDRAAMTSGAVGTEDYLAGWHKVSAGTMGGSDAAAAEAARLDAAYDPARLVALVRNGGHAVPREA